MLAVMKMTCLLVLAMTLGPTLVYSGAVMSVDLGSEFFKVGVVSPGVPMEIVLNIESKRKTPLAVAFRDGERSFNTEAMVTAVKYPAKAYLRFVDLVGKRHDHPQVLRYLNLYPYYKVRPITVYGKRGENDSFVFVHPEKNGNGTQWEFSPTELVAMIIEESRRMTEAYTGQQVSEAVIAVPAYFDILERTEIMTACKLAKVKCSQLISSSTAVALNYGLFRMKELGHYGNASRNVLFYDMGSQATTAFVAHYEVIETKERGYTQHFPLVQITGLDYDRNLGGHHLTRVVRDYLAVEFNRAKLTESDVKEIPRSMAKLMKEADRVKSVLSANSETMAQCESVVEDFDLPRTVFSREMLLELAGEAFVSRLLVPLEKAVDLSGLAWSEIYEVIIVGGGTRVPRIQELLTNYLEQKAGIEAGAGDSSLSEPDVSNASSTWTGPSKLSRNMNFEESAAIGAVYRAADLSDGFKVKPFRTREAVLFPIEIAYSRSSPGNGDDDGEEAEGLTVKRTVFDLMHTFPQRKVMTFNKHDLADFEFIVRHPQVISHLRPDQAESVIRTDLATYKLTGVADVIKNYTSGDSSSGYVAKGLRVHVGMDESGLVAEVDKVEAQFEKQLSVEDQLAALDEEEKVSVAKHEAKMASERTTIAADSDVETDSSDELLSDEGSWSETLSNLFASGEEFETNSTTSDDKEEQKTKDGGESESKKAKKDKPAKAKPKKSKEERLKQLEERAKKEAKKIKVDYERRRTKIVKVKTLSQKAPVNVELVTTQMNRVMSDEANAVSASKLAVLNAVAEMKMKRDMAINQLETDMALIRERLTDEVDADHADSPDDDLRSRYFWAASLSDAERTELTGLVGQISNWIDEDYMPKETDVAELTSRQDQLESATAKWRERAGEHLARSQALQTIQTVLEHATSFGDQIRNASTVDSTVVTETDMDELEKEMAEVKDWLDAKVQEQSRLALSDDIVLLASDLDERGRHLEQTVKRLLSKIKVAKKLREYEEAASTNKTMTEDKTGDDEAENETVSDDEESANDDDVTPPTGGGEEMQEPPQDEAEHQTSEQADKEEL